MEANEHNPLRRPFVESLIAETESEPSTVYSNAQSAYSALSEKTTALIRGRWKQIPELSIQIGTKDVIEERLTYEVRRMHAEERMRQKRQLAALRQELYERHGQDHLYRKPLSEPGFSFDLPISSKSPRSEYQNEETHYEERMRQKRKLAALRQELYERREQYRKSLSEPGFSSDLPISSKPPRSEYQNKETHYEQELASKSALSNNHEVRIFEIPCQLANHSTNALGDYGARKNFMREEYALRLGLPISRKSARKVTIGSGKEVTTVGTATVPFRFTGENEGHKLEFQLLPNCIHNVIIGKAFLKLTETFSNIANFCRRVKERVAKGISQFHLLYLGAFTPMFEGSINGQVQTALADSGSKVLLMDEAYARSIGLHIQTGHEHQTRLKFADNSVTDTVGMVYNVKWRFGHDGEFTSPYPLNFHILENAPANVVLSDTFLFDTRAFSEYHRYLIDDDDDCEDEDPLIHLLAIDIDKRKKRTEVNIASFSLADLRHLELVRRGEEADHISTLSKANGTAAQIIENERCAEWDRTFTAVHTKDRPQSLQLLSVAAVSQIQSTTSSHSSTSGLKGSRSNQTHKRGFLKFSTWLKRGILSTS
ncbi:hypothetical protein PEXP_068820 [Penicillium expansum]|nr:hypothetical protein PEXP_068820 [Penicillium expansum]